MSVNISLLENFLKTQEQIKTANKSQTNVPSKNSIFNLFETDSKTNISHVFGLIFSH